MPANQRDVVPAKHVGRVAHIASGSQDTRRVERAEDDQVAVLSLHALELEERDPRQRRHVGPEAPAEEQVARVHALQELKPVVHSAAVQLHEALRVVTVHASDAVREQCARLTSKQLEQRELGR